MDKSSLKKEYEHFFKPTPPDPLYPNGYKRILLNESNFPKFLDLAEKSTGRLACDTETTGLDPSILQMVGVSCCFEDKRSFYMPFRHKIDTNLNMSMDCFTQFYERVLKKRNVLWYNYPFDGHVLDVEGYDIENLDITDVMDVVWLLDSNWKEISLKWMANHFLGWRMETYEEVTGGLEDFSYLSPKVAVNYASDDALATRALFLKAYPILEPRSSFTMKLDSLCCLPLIRAHQTEHNVDLQTLLNVENEIETQLPDLEREIFRHCGRSFNIGSPSQVADTLEDLGIDTGQRTKGNKLKTGADLLEKVDHPVAQLIVRYKAISTWRNNFINPLKKVLNAHQPVRFKYFACGVPTGRFKAGKDTKAKGWFTPINIQAVIKPHMIKRYAYKSDSPEAVLGWIFTDEPNDYPVEYPDPKFNIRRAFKAPEGFYYVKADFAAQELRIPANISKEPIWTEAFLSGQDIHDNVCREVFGELNHDNRAKTKIVNFSALYGATAYTLAAKLGMAQEEAENFLNRYKSKLRVLFRWHDAIIREAGRMGQTFTAFGRPRRLAHWFSSPDRKVRNFAKRSAVNGVVQGTAADIFRIAFVNLYKKLFRVEKDDCLFRKVIHDEIDFVLRKNRTELLDTVIDLMQVKRKDWPVLMEVGIEVGTCWGDMVAFVKGENNEWVPKRK